MKKIILFSLVGGLLFGSVNIYQGWNNIGVSKSSNVKKIFNNEDFKYVWYFNPINKKWNFYSFNEYFLNYAKEKGFEIIPDVLPDGSAVWVYSDINTSIEKNDNNYFNSYTSSSFNGVRYAVGKKDGNLYLAEGDINKWNKFILLENNVTNISNVLMNVDENNVLFSYMIGDNNKSVYVGSFDGEKVSKKLVKTFNNGRVFPHAHKIFNDPVN
jgi:hypothetical protein